MELLITIPFPWTSTRENRFLVIISALQLVSAGENPVVRNVHGTVGRSVHLRCVLENLDTVDRVYFQRMAKNGSAIFVNGFYSKMLLVLPEYINRTIVNRTQLSMVLLNLSLADEGEYDCIPFSKDQLEIKTKFYLTVTANYNNPTITAQGCGIDPATHNCMVTCSSSGGFPKSNTTWHVAGAEMSSFLRDKGELVFMQDKQSKLWNVSQDIQLNCSRPLNITCSVGGAVSQAVSVCPTPGGTPNLTIIACIVLLMVSCVIGITVVIKYRGTLLRTVPAERSADAELVSLK